MLETFAKQDSLVTRAVYRRGVNLFFLYVGLVTLAYGLATARFYRSWTIADWLINYEGGFVRRGLLGQVAFELGRLFHCTPVAFVVLFYLSFYAALLLAGRALALRAAPSFWCLAVLLSPATFSFPVLDANGGFRKEILYLALLALSIVLLPRMQMRPAARSLLLTAIVCVVVLSHEALICYVPYFFAVLVLQGRTLRQSAQEFALPLLAGLVAAFASARHLGDWSTATAICGSLGYPLQAQGKQICAGGALEFLTFSSAKARSLAWLSIRRDGYVLIYPAGAVLALLPLVAGSKALVRGGLRREVRALWLVAAASFLASLVLFVYAGDWGRWIYIHVLSLALLLLYLDGRRPTPAHAEPGAVLLAPGQRRAAAWTLVAYATLWSLPHIPGRTPPLGYLGLLHYVLLHLHL